MPSTPSSRAISLVVFVVSLYRITEVRRDVTDTPLMRARQPTDRRLHHRDPRSRPPRVSPSSSGQQVETASNRMGESRRGLAPESPREQPRPVSGQQDHDGSANHQGLPKTNFSPGPWILFPAGTCARASGFQRCNQARKRRPGPLRRIPGQDTRETRPVAAQRYRCERVGCLN